MQNDDRAQRLEIHKTPIWEDEPEDFFGDSKVAYVHEPQVPPEDRPRESNYVLEPGTAHYKPVHEDTPGPASIGEPRGEILRLAQKVTDRIGHAVTTSDPEYWGLAAFVTPEMAHVANRMDVRVPYTLPQLMKLTGKSEAYLQPLLYEMSVRGLIEYNWENPKHEKQWILLPFVPGSAEFAVMNQAQLRDHPELATFFNRMTFLPLEKVTPMVPPGGAGIGMHVIPVERAISMENEAVDLERISYWLDKYEGRYSIGACSCRVCEQVRGDGCADDAQGWCIGLGDMAQYSIETGKGRYATREEVMEVLRRAEENGQHRRRGQDLCHLQLQREHLLRAAHLAALQHAQHEPLRLRGGGRPGEVRGLRRLRGGVPGGRAAAGPEDPHAQGLRRVPAPAPAGRPPLGPAHVGSGLPRQQPHRDARHRYGPLQGGLPGARTRAGLPAQGR